MNNEPPKPPDSGLQFDKAEFAQGAALVCAVCKTPIVGEFYQANGQSICPTCAKGVKASTQLPIGLAVGRSVIAALVAGAAGGLVWWLVSNLTGAWWGIIAVLVGWMVGYAVRWGSGGIGGPLFQGIAMVITYLAIAGSYLPRLIPRTENLAEALRIAITAPLPSSAGDILGVVILGFALYEAWSMNRATELQISGPYSAARPS
jgi:hypothetical protein